MRKLISVMFLCLFCLVFSSCRGFVETETKEILNVYHEVLADGRTKVVIEYSDELSEPNVFYLPAGQDGNGIKNVNSFLSDDGKSTIVELIFTDKNAKPIKVAIPNGISITGVTSKFNPVTLNTEIVVTYSNGTTSDPILIPKGEKGDTGTMLINYQATTNADGSQTIVFEYSNDTKYEIHVPAPLKGDTGNGIEFIESREIDDKYILIITYTDGTTSNVEFNRPRDPNTWLRGNNDPTDTLGKDGDYYFDVIHNNIWTKIDGSWEVVMDFKDDVQEYVIKFDLNASDALMPTGYYKQYRVSANTYFTDIPIPVRPGYDFVGWCTDQNPTPVSGYFTRLTPVLADITLYAIWAPQA